MRRGGKIVITVEDNGEGIPPEIQGRVFEMFYRGSLRAKGSGLGLFIAKEAIETINGRITFTSELGKGSAFHIELEEVAEIRNNKSDDRTYPQRLSINQKKSRTRREVFFIEVWLRQPTVLVVIDKNLFPSL